MSDRFPDTDVEVRWNDSDATVTISGGLDLTEAPSVSACLDSVVSKQPAHLVAQRPESSGAARNTSTPDLVELIMGEHARISKLIEKLESALAVTGPVGSQCDPDLVWAQLADFLQFHIDAAEEIAYLAWARAATDAVPAIMQEIAIDADIREAVQEARASLPGSRSWHMSVRAACIVARKHISNLESGPLTCIGRHIAPATRRDLGGQWAAFMTAQALDAAAQARGRSAPA
jgi:hypothetical protein